MSDLHWNDISPYAVPLGISALLGVLAWALFAWLAHRSRGKDYRRARITSMLSPPLALLLPLLFLRVVWTPHR